MEKPAKAQGTFCRPVRSEESVGNDPAGEGLFERRSYFGSFSRKGLRTFTGHMGISRKELFNWRILTTGSSAVTIDGSFEILPRTGKWIHRHRMILTIHEPIPPKGKGMENIKATMAEAYAAVESALPEKHKGMIKNEDQDR